MLTTNDVRAIRTVLEEEADAARVVGGRVAPGGWTANDFQAYLRWTTAGGDPVVRRLPSLVERGLFDLRVEPGGSRYYVTAAGRREYQRAVAA